MTINEAYLSEAKTEKAFREAMPKPSPRRLKHLPAHLKEHRQLDLTGVGKKPFAFTPEQEKALTDALTPGQSGKNFVERVVASLAARNDHIRKLGDEAVSVGTIALARSVPTFNPLRCKLTTHAYKLVIWAVLRRGRQEFTKNGYGSRKKDTLDNEDKDFPDSKSQSVEHRLTRSEEEEAVVKITGSLPNGSMAEHNQLKAIAKNLGIRHTMGIRTDNLRLQVAEEVRMRLSAVNQSQPPVNQEPKAPGCPPAVVRLVLAWTRASSASEAAQSLHKPIRTIIRMANLLRRAGVRLKQMA